MRTNEKTNFIPVVMFGGSDDIQDIEMSYKRGANSYTRKPAESNAFAEVIERVADYWLRLNVCACRAN
jgi:FixJ family two-component response regulator